MGPKVVIHCGNCGAKIRINESRYVLLVVPGFFSVLCGLRLMEAADPVVWGGLLALAILAMVYIVLFYVTYELAE